MVAKYPNGPRTLAANLIGGGDTSMNTRTPEPSSSIVLGVADRILAYRDRIAKLGEFDLRCRYQLRVRTPNPTPVVSPAIAAANSTGQVVGAGSPFAAR